MGLGKSLQTIALLSYMMRERGLKGPSLVVCPLSVLSSWMAEFARWAPHLRIVRMHVSGQDQKRVLRREVRPSRLLHAGKQYCPGAQSCCSLRCSAICQHDCCWSSAGCLA